MKATASDHHLASLNAQQRLAVEHGTDPSKPGRTGPLLVIAGAGSGKTKTLAHRVAHLIHNCADAERILLLTFSRRAAMEMERRAGEILVRVAGAASKSRPLRWSGTFHSVGARLLREFAARIGLQERFSIVDRADAEDLLAIVRHELGLSAPRRRFPSKSTCLAIYSRVVNSGSSLDEVLAHAYPWCAEWQLELRKLFDAYVGAKAAQQVLDFDDLLLHWLHMVQEPRLAREIGERFDHVLVDEYQDTNRLQASILLAMKPDGNGLTVVGDDAQSIYSFRAATVRNILGFPTSFVPPARIVTLDRNYRSAQPILTASNAVIGMAAERFTKNLWTDRLSSRMPCLVTVRDERDQARYVVERVLERNERGMALKSQAILFRSSGHSTELELELARCGIPFVKYGGLQFLEAAHIKDVLSVLRWADNPRNRTAGFRAAKLIGGVGPAIATRVLDALRGASNPITTLESLSIPPSIAGDWGAFLTAFRLVCTEDADWPHALEVVTRWYEPQLHRLYEDAAVRQGDLGQLLRIASTYPTRERFLTELTLDPPEATSDRAGVPSRDDDYLVLSTIHSAKGMEWNAVHVLNVVDGCIPSDMATGTTDEIEEERRLLYVAMTRAKDELHLTVPQRFYVRQQSAVGDRHVYAARSRFIPDEIATLFETLAWPAADMEHDATDNSTHDAGGVAVDVVARARALWR